MCVCVLCLWYVSDSFDSKSLISTQNGELRTKKKRTGDKNKTKIESKCIWTKAEVSEWVLCQQECDLFFFISVLATREWLWVKRKWELREKYASRISRRGSSAMLDEFLFSAENIYAFHFIFLFRQRHHRCDRRFLFGHWIWPQNRNSHQYPAQLDIFDRTLFGL